MKINSIECEAELYDLEKSERPLNYSHMASQEDLGEEGLIGQEPKQQESARFFLK